MMRRFVVAFVVSSLLIPLPTQADSSLSGRASAEVSAYADDTNVQVVTPTIAGTIENPTAGWGIDGRYLVDVVSAASPDIVATASPGFTEVRHGASLEGRYRSSNASLGASGSLSLEPDYRSLTAGIRGTLDMAQKNLTWLGGYAFRHDTAGRRGTPFDVFAYQLARHDLTGGLSLVVNPRLLTSVQLDAMMERGVQAKPYRYVPLFDAQSAAEIPEGASVALVSAMRLHTRALEALPTRRDRFALTFRIAHRGKRATLRLEERLYTDTWGMMASTTDGRYLIDIGSVLTIWPHARLHVQGGADFWRRATIAEVDSSGNLSIPAIRTGDRELGPLWSGTLGGGISLQLGSRLAVSFKLDGVLTQYLDSIYITRRAAVFSAVDVRVTFD